MTLNSVLAYAMKCENPLIFDLGISAHTNNFAERVLGIQLRELSIYLDVRKSRQMAALWHANEDVSLLFLRQCGQRS